MNQLPFKISVLVFVRDEKDRHLLISRLKEPNKGCWSPIGGKLEMALGESPFECAVREVGEEIGLSITEDDLHLFSMISEKGYEGNCHWLMFLFDCKKRIKELPKSINEGSFGFFSQEEIKDLNIPETDRILLWDIWKKCADNGSQTILRADCHDGVKAVVEEFIESRKVKD